MQHRDLWYKNAIIYCLDVETYMDANGDGIGDFEGLISRLDKLAGVGITCIWLLPFYPSPNRDNGYDIVDYYGVDPRLGTLGDFVEFMVRAREYGIRVIIDLVVNHTSDQHPWFQAARSDPNSRFRDYYVWSETKPEDADEGIVFPGVQESTWTYDEQAGAYYFHRFYKHQPDLNIANPAVQEEIRKIMGFWLELGVSGFRMDAAPFVIEMKGVQETEGKDNHQYLEEFRQFLSWRRGDAIILAEANVDMDKVPEYFGEGDRLHMLFHFLLNQYLFLAVARGQAEPLVHGLTAPPSAPPTAQWAIFLRNHDELNLDRLPEPARKEVFAKFGPEPNMQIYDRGIRRRLAPILSNDRRCLELVHSLMFTLPGTPVIWYGQEIGMGDDLSLSERNSVRTPMQWSAEKNGGFSSAPPDSLIRPVIDKGEYSYEKVNFTDQNRDKSSLLNWMERLIRARKECPEFGFGDWEIIGTNHPAVFAHSCQWNGGIVLAVHNLSDQQIDFELDISHMNVRHMVDILGDEVYKPESKTHHQVNLNPYGYRWFRIQMDYEGDQT